MQSGCATQAYNLPLHATASMASILASHEAVAVCVINTTLNVCALGLNGVLLSRIARQARLNLSHKLTFAVYVVDLVFCVEMAATYSLRGTIGPAFYADGRLRNAMAALAFFLPCASSLLVSLLAVERWLRVCKDWGLLPLPSLLAAAAVLLVHLALCIATAAVDGYTVDPGQLFFVPGGHPCARAMDIATRVILIASIVVVIPC